jgi:predicted naringenin-chalcone synthase
MNSQNAHIASLAVATPPLSMDQRDLEPLAQKHYKGRLSSRSLSLIRTLFLHPSIKRRSFAVDNVESLVDEDLDARITRFTFWSLELSAQAVKQALAGRSRYRRC